MRRSQNDDVLSGPMVTGVGKVGFRHWLPGAPRGRIAHDHLGGTTLRTSSPARSFVARAERAVRFAKAPDFAGR